MNEQLTLQSTQHEETKTVPLRRRKACLAGTFALFAACALVLLIPHPAYAGIIGDFLDIPNMIKTWLLQIAATLFNTYFGVINQTLDAKFISGPFNELFGTTEPYGVVKDFYQAGVIPVAHAILGLFMLMQLIKISQRIDATSTLPAVKDIVFLVVTYCILSYFIDNALDLVSAIYSIFNDLVGNVSDKLQSKNWYEPGIKMTKDDAADATFGGCFLLLIFGLISWAVGLVFYAVSMVVALGRSVQLYVYAAFSPIPISLLGFEETKQIGIGYLKNFAAAALAGVVMVLILYLYPHLVTALAVSGGLGKAEMLGLAQGVETFDSFGVIIKTIADGEGATGSGIPTREEVRSHFAEMGFAVDPDRFFDVNEGRGWRTNSGKPVDDWKKLAAVWDRNEHPKAATPPARTEPKANAVGKIPSVEEVMAKWGCDRETAQGYIDENMY